MCHIRSAGLPTPHILHPTPHTLHPTPHSLLPTPHTLQPTPYTIHTTLDHLVTLEWDGVRHGSFSLLFFFITLEPRVEQKSISLKCEPSSEPLHILSPSPSSVRLKLDVCKNTFRSGQTSSPWTGTGYGMARVGHGRSFHTTPPPRALFARQVERG